MPSLLDLLGKAQFKKVNTSGMSAFFCHDLPLSEYIDQISAPVYYCANKNDEEFILIDPVEYKSDSPKTLEVPSDHILMTLRSFEDQKSKFYSAPIQIMVIPKVGPDNESTLFNWIVTFTETSSKNLDQYMRDSRSTKTFKFNFKKKIESPEYPEWDKRLDKALKRLNDENDLLSKVVLSRAIEFHSESTLDANQIFLKMLEKAKGVFKIFLRNKDNQFISFSPESLHQMKYQEGELILNLEAIAGTRPRFGEDTSDTKRKNEISQEELFNDPKEREEHQKVIDQLLEGVRSLGEVTLGETGILTLKSLYHLRTPIEVRLNSPDNRNTSTQDILGLLNVLDGLHPTPAVCGTPTDKAKELISDLEPPRGYYAGLLGVYANPKSLNKPPLGHSTVLIRSLNIEKKKIEAIGGAGIVKDSVALAEWQETANKVDSFMDLLLEENTSPKKLQQDNQTNNIDHKVIQLEN